MLTLTVFLMVFLSVSTLVACGEEEMPSEGGKPSKELVYTLDKVTDTYWVTGYAGNPTNVVIPSIYEGKTVARIGEKAFDGCSSLTSVQLPNGLLSIGDSAFGNCGFTSLVIPNSVVEFGEDVFVYSNKLKSLYIGSGVTKISAGCFGYAISSITVDENNPVYKSIDGNLYDKDATTLIAYACGKVETKFTVPSTVTRIGEYAFCQATSLRTIEIPITVTAIGREAFSWCDSLNYIVIPESVTEMDYDVFDSTPHAIVLCKAESQPSGWDANWNEQGLTVVWGYVPEEI